MAQQNGQDSWSNYPSGNEYGGAGYSPGQFQQPVQQPDSADNQASARYQPGYQQSYPYGQQSVVSAGQSGRVLRPQAVQAGYAMQDAVYAQRRGQELPYAGQNLPGQACQARVRPGVPAGQCAIPQQHFAQGPSPYDARAPRPVQSSYEMAVGKNRSANAQTSSFGPKIVLALFIGLVLGAVLGAVLFSFISGGSGGAPTPIGATLGASQLQTVVGTYRYEGKTYEITAQDAILGSGSLSGAQNADGSYRAPSADNVLSYARNMILAELVQENGIEVSSDEVAQYAQNLIGTSDTDAVAVYFGMESSDAQRLLTEAAAVGKLREKIVGNVGIGLQAPELPADGNSEVGTAAYADYIIGLLGSYWDSAAQTWANTDNLYYEALKDEVFAPGSASYDAAQIAYGIALDALGDTASSQEIWTDYVNGYLNEAAISVRTLGA